MGNLYIPILAGIITAISQIPQANLIYKTNKTRDVSLCTYLLFSISSTLWLVYGYMIKDKGILIGQIIILPFVYYIFTKKLIDSS